MGSSSIAEYIKTCSEQLNRHLRQSFPSDWHIDPTLKEAMEYSLFAGGKRLRPILVLAAAEAAGGEADAAMPVACAIEMVHTYSLIHDDLPAMDDDDYRRGRPTNHKVFGDGMAILAGDALLTHAFFCAAQIAKDGRVPAERALAVIEELAMYAGARGMVGGQAADLKGKQGLTKLEDLESIHLRKTGDLIVFSLRAGGRIGGATDDQLAALERFGYDIGLAFQIQDDVLNVIGDEKKLGKPVKSDEKRNKATYPYFVGVEESKRSVERLTRRSKEAIERAGFPRPERLLEIADYLMKRDH